MRDFLDFLARWVEPYVSFRWMVAMIFGGMIQFLLDFTRLMGVL